jgi:hypothetical protein
MNYINDACVKPPEPIFIVSFITEIDVVKLAALRAIRALSKNSALFVQLMSC